MTPDAYDSTPPRGTALAWTRVYQLGGEHAHLRHEDGFGDIACLGPLSDENGQDDNWLGTGGQEEYELAAALPLCEACFRVREAGLSDS